jgi:hypothetical protein
VYASVINDEVIKPKAPDGVKRDPTTGMAGRRHRDDAPPAGGTIRSAGTASGG